MYSLQLLVNVKVENVEKEAKPQRKKVVLGNLPDAATKDSIFSRQVIPLFTNIIFAGDVPWPLDEHDIVPHLEAAWDEVFRRKLQIDIGKGSAPYNLVLFFLSLT